MPLQPPPPRFSELDLPTVEIDAQTLHRVSKHDTGEPYFGRSGANRFDDPTRAKAKRFGTCYCGYDLHTAIAETVLHDEIPARGRFRIASRYMSSRYLVRFKPGPLVLADLTGAALKSLGGDGSLSTEQPYTMPKRWSLAVHRHPLAVDGIQYVSRHLNDRKATVIFERARDKLQVLSIDPLDTVSDLGLVLRELRVDLILIG